MFDKWEDRPADCKCEPPFSSKISLCPIHCSCMINGQEIPNSKRIDGQCKRCGNWPFYTLEDILGEPE